MLVGAEPFVMAMDSSAAPALVDRQAGAAVVVDTLVATLARSGLEWS